MGDLDKSTKMRKNKVLKPKKVGAEIEKEDHENERSQLVKKKKRKGAKEDNTDADKQVNSEREKKKRKLKTKKGQRADNQAAGQDTSKTLEGVNDSPQQDGVAVTEMKLRKHKKSKKKGKKEHGIPKEAENAIPNQGQLNDFDQDDEVYCISSGDEDNSKGMKKWITEYHQTRPGLKVLQQRIDEFIVAHEEKLEQERKEREAKIAEDGWTVVTHHKGRKKTTDAETGTTVGSVAPLVAQEQLAKKKSKGVGQDFYRFQKREAQRNEILKLQSKFEEDKKRIQQLRAARKFKPY